MTQGQRRVHALVWPVLVEVIGAGLWERARIAEAAAAVEAG